MKQEEIAQALAPIVKDCGLFMEDVAIIKAGKHSRLQVTVDKEEGPGGVDTQALEDATRKISQWCDDVDPLKGAYNLEVSTPGIDRPLTTWRHFSRAVTHRVALSVNGEEIEGVVADVGDNSVTLQTDDGIREFSLDDIDSAHMVVSL